MQSRKFIISGGGTGGHIFPAIAIANALKQRNAAFEILFVGANGRMEMEKVPAAGYNIIGLNISGLQRSLSLKNLLFPFKLIGSLMKARSILKNFRPDVVVGVGGYASGPMLRAATQRRIPALIQEQNSYPGITNRLLSKKVNKICVAYEGMEKYFPKNKIILTGNPVRKEVVQIDGKREEGLRFFELQQDKTTLLVIGGSLGSFTINESIAKNLEVFTNAGLQVIWQTGKGYISQAEDMLAGGKYPSIKAQAFINKMDLAYAACDLVVSRAGAIAVSELSLVGKACILVPLPSAAEDHQTKNAMALVNNNAAVLVKDSESRNTLGKEVLALASDETRKKSLEVNIAKLGRKDAADVIAEHVLTLANA